MSDELTQSSIDSTIDEERDSTIDSLTRNRAPSKLTTRLKTLFVCCFKRNRRKGEGPKEIVEYDPDEYDYIIEKLLVKRVPLAIFAIQTDLDRRRSYVAIQDNTSQSTSLSTFDKSNPTVNVISQGTSSMKAVTNICATYCGRNKNKNSLVRTSLDQDIEYLGASNSVSREEIFDRLNTIDMDLKQSERSNKKISQNISRNKKSFTEDIFEIMSSARTNVSSTRKSTIGHDDVPYHKKSMHNYPRNLSCRSGIKRNKRQAKKANNLKQLRDVSSVRNANHNFIAGRNTKYVVSPLQRGSFNLKKPANIIGDCAMDDKSLTRIKGSSKNRSDLIDNLKKCDSSDAAVRWRITIRHQQANASTDPVVSKV